MIHLRRAFLSTIVVVAVAGLPGCRKSDAGTQSPGGGGAIPATAVPPVTYGAEADVPAAVQDECELDTKIPQWLAEYAPGATPSAPGEGGRVLTLEIVGMMGAGGGMYSGPKQMTMIGTLTEGGQVIGSFRARRTTTGGAWGGYKGTCSLLARTGKALAKDIGEWLRHPTADAKLGEL
jgi:hypothetical protein